MPAGGIFSGGVGIVLYFAFLFGLMWFIIIRPQKKREKEARELQESIKVGDTVVTSTGMYGKVVDSVNDVFVIEFGLNKSIRIPVQKQAVTGVREPNLTVTKEVEEEVKETKKEA